MTDKVSIKTTVHFKPFQTPNFVCAVAGAAPDEAGWKDGQPVQVKDLEPEALDALAWQWLTHLYAGVGRPVPFRLPDHMLASQAAQKALGR